MTSPDTHLLSMADSIFRVESSGALFSNFKVVINPKVYKFVIYSGIIMAEDYNPTRKEVLGEMVKNIGSKLKQTSKHSLEMSWFIAIRPYILPTTIRGVRNATGDTQLDSTHKVGYSAGLVGGIALDVAQVMGYSYAVKNDHPEALLIPVLTNVASGVYEAGRSMYNGARKRVLDKHKAEGLEATVQTPQE